MRSTNAPVPGRAAAWVANLTSGRRLSCRHPRRLTRVAAARLHLPVVPNPPGQNTPRAAARRQSFQTRLGRRQTASLRSCPPGWAPAGLGTAAPLPAAAAAALTSEHTSDCQRPTARTLFRERTNTLKATASPPPSARPATALAHAGSAPGSWGAPRGSPGRRVFRWLWLGPALRGRLGFVILKPESVH